MNMTEKNGQPSMEEILASIRRIIAEEPANQAYGDFRGGQPIVLKGDGVLDDAGDFDLPAIFRSSSLPAPDRPAPLLGRLTDAIRNATATPAEGASPSNGEDTAHSNGSGLNGAKPDAHQPYQGLSSLQPVRAEAYHGDGAVPLNGASHGNSAHNGQAHAAAPASEPAAPVTSASAGSSEQPKRVMAAFKDTHFMKMSAPVSAAPAPAPSPAVPEPAAFVPPAPVAAEPVAFFEAERPLPPVAAYVEEVPEEVPAPQVVSMPPPPLPASAGPQEAVEGVGSIEDTTADLLRPMLRQWLADNMPRMVEKALHIEIAESVKPLKKP